MRDAPTVHARGLAGHRAATLAILCATCFSLACIAWAMVDARGVDPHWYLSDTRTLAEGEPPHGHTVFAGLVARGGAPADRPARFLHNGPLLHVQAWLAQRVEAVAAWRLTNGVALVGAAVLVGITAGHLGGPVAATTATVLYLVAPLSVWLASNVYQETSLAALVACVTWLVVCRYDRRAARLAAGLLLAFGQLAHPAFGVGAFVFALDACRRRHLAEGITVVVALGIAVAFDARLFPSDFPPTLTDIARSSIPGGSNMLWQLADALPALDLSLFAARLTFAIQGQFFTPRNLPFTLIANAGLVAMVWLVWRNRFTRDPSTTRLIVVALVAHALFAALCILLQYIPRYLMLIAPVSIAVLSVAVAGVRAPGRGATIVATVGLAACLAVDIHAVRLLREDIDRTSEAQTALVDTLGPLPDATRIAMLGSDAAERFVPLIAALSPRLVLLADRELIDADRLDRVIAAFDPHVVVRDRALSESADEPVTMPGGEVLHVERRATLSRATARPPAIRRATPPPAWSVEPRSPPQLRERPSR